MRLRNKDVIESIDKTHSNTTIRSRIVFRIKAFFRWLRKNRVLFFLYFIGLVPYICVLGAPSLLETLNIGGNEVPVIMSPSTESTTTKSLLKMGYKERESYLLNLFGNQKYDELIEMSDMVLADIDSGLVDWRYQFQYSIIKGFALFLKGEDAKALEALRASDNVDVQMNETILLLIMDDYEGVIGANDISWMAEVVKGSANIALETYDGLADSQRGYHIPNESYVGASAWVLHNTQRAYADIREENYYTAEGYADRVLELRPSDCLANQYKSIALAGQGRYQESLDQYIYTGEMCETFVTTEKLERKAGLCTDFVCYFREHTDYFKRNLSLENRISKEKIEAEIFREGEYFSYKVDVRKVEENSEATEWIEELLSKALDFAWEDVLAKPYERMAFFRHTGEYFSQGIPDSFENFTYYVGWWGIEVDTSKKYFADGFELEYSPLDPALIPYVTDVNYCEIDSDCVIRHDACQYGSFNEYEVYYNGIGCVAAIDEEGNHYGGPEGNYDSKRDCAEMIAYGGSKCIDNVCIAQNPYTYCEQYLDIGDTTRIVSLPNCPLDEIKSNYSSNNFSIMVVDCGYLETGQYTGEDVTVEIYTPNLETGKAEFRDWLAEHGLEESEKLRVEYVHKPK